MQARAREKEKRPKDILRFLATPGGKTTNGNEGLKIFRIAMAKNSHTVP